ncbi:MAG: glycosyltransferase [Azonexus sp.]
MTVRNLTRQLPFKRLAGYERDFTGFNEILVSSKHCRHRTACILDPPGRPVSTFKQHHARISCIFLFVGNPYKENISPHNYLMAAPKVSVVIASYNHDQYIEECLNSVLNQSFQDVEILVTDDGSTDTTQKILARFCDPRLKVEFFPENRGACIALNNCIRKASGEYIAVLNSDDLFLPGKLALQVGYLDAHPSIAATFGLPAFIDERGQLFSDTKHKDYSAFQVENQHHYSWLRRFFDKGNCLCHPTAMIRRECYTKLGLYDPRLAQVPDLDMWIRLCSQHDIFLIDDAVTAFRIRDNMKNASSGRPDVIIRDAWERSHILKHYLRLDNDVFTRVFPEYDENLSSPEWWLGLYSLQAGTPFHSAFGLDCLFRSLEQEPWNSRRHSEFILLTGRIDLYNLLREKFSLGPDSLDTQATSKHLPESGTASQAPSTSIFARIANLLRSN